MTMLKMTIDAFERTRRTPWTIGTIRTKPEKDMIGAGTLYHIQLGTHGIRVTHYYSEWNEATNFWTYSECDKFFDVPFDRDSYTTE